MPDRWAILFEGDVAEFDEPLRLFAEGPIRIREVRIARDQSGVALQADEIEEKDTPFEALATAERLLDCVNGALFLTDTGRRSLRFSLVVWERGGAGIYDRGHAFMRAHPIRIRFDAWGELTAAGGQTPPAEAVPKRPIEVEALTLSASDEAVKEVLTYLRADPDHPTLYNAYERIKRDVVEAQARWQASGEKGTRPEFPWADAQEEEFRRSSQPFRHGDPARWAGRDRKTAMPLPEAHTLMSKWARKWLEWKLLNRSISPESPAPSARWNGAHCADTLPALPQSVPPCVPPSLTSPTSAPAQPSHPNRTP